MNDLLHQGIIAYKAGKRDEARKNFLALVKQEPNNESVWGWLYQVSNNDQERIHCMKQVLRINPKNEKASQLLNKLLAPATPIPNSDQDNPPATSTKKCPYCAELIQSDAIVCRFCGRDLSPQQKPTTTQVNRPQAIKPEPVRKQNSYVVNIFIVLVLAFVGICACITIIGSLGGGGGVSSRTVKYVVTGNTRTSSVNYTNASNGDDSLDVYLPFEKEITMKDSGFVSILAWPGGEGLTGSITCEIWLNGKLEETSTANNTLVTCGAYVP